MPLKKKRRSGWIPLIDSKIYPCLLRSLIVILGLLTLSGVYDRYYGFQIAVGLLTALSLSLLMIFNYLKVNRVLFLWYLLYFAYIISIALFIHRGGYYYSLSYLTFIFLFIVALPSLNRELPVYITTQVFILKFITLIALIFIVLNFETYITRGLFLEKHTFVSVMSGYNLTCYLFYLGFSISWMLYDHTKKKTYALLCVVFFLYSVLLTYSVTIYVAVFTYIIIINFLKSSYAFRKLCLFATLLFATLFYSDLFVWLEQNQSLLSDRYLLHMKSFELIQDKLWFGYGINGWGYLTNLIKNPHNVLLYIMLSFGVTGLAVWSLHFIFLLKISLKKMRDHKHTNLFKHMYAQLLVNTLIMLSFVSTPGHYQDSSLWLSLVYSIIINGIVYVCKNPTVPVTNPPKKPQLD